MDQQLTKLTKMVLAFSLLVMVVAVFVAVHTFQINSLKRDMNTMKEFQSNQLEFDEAVTEQLKGEQAE